MDPYSHNSPYQVDRSLVAAQKLGLTNGHRPFHPLPGTNRADYSPWADPSCQMHKGGNNNFQRGNEYRGYQQLPPSNKRGQVGRRTRGRSRGTPPISQSVTAPKPVIKPDLSFNFKLFDHFEDGMMFLCNKFTEEECLKNMIFAASAARMEDMIKITDKTALFLYRLTPNKCVLHGVFQAEGLPGLQLVPSAFNGRFPAQIRVKPFFRFPNSVPYDRLNKVLADDNRCRKLSKQETRLLFKEFSQLYIKDTLLTYLTRQMGLNEFVPICSLAFGFTKEENEAIRKSCFE